MKMFDSVKLVNNRNCLDIPVGSNGVILDLFSSPSPAYLIEFFDAQGISLNSHIVYPQQIIKIIHEK